MIIFSYQYRDIINVDSKELTNLDHYMYCHFIKIVQKQLEE